LKSRNFWFISQGIFDKNGVLIKTELLARLQGLDGTIFPDVFIPVIETIGHKTIFDYLVIEKAFKSIARIKPNIPCSININPSTFKDWIFLLSYIDRLQKLYDINPKKIIFEILETEPIHDYEKFNRIFGEFRKRWYQIAVDDVHPIGYRDFLCVSNLSEIDTIKFDGIYITELYNNKDERLVTQELLTTIRDIIDKHPHIDIVIEKIEYREMFEFFRDIFNDSWIENVYFQGYYFDRGSDF
jgi:EAL domain-containing protein (putative c-di-GMP-specific phosphodiesterase class I)